MRRLVLAAGAAGLLLSPASAGDQYVGRRLGTTYLKDCQTKAQASEALTQAFRRLDLNKDGVVSFTDEELRRTAAEIRGRQERAALIGKWIGMDYEGTGRVSAESLRKIAKAKVGTLPVAFGAAAGDPRVAEMVAKLEAEAMKQIDGEMQKGDANHDGVVDWDEMFAQARQSRPDDRRVRQMPDDFLGVMGFDADGDGQVTAAEIATGFEAMFAAIDVDQDGVVSSDEFKAYFQMRPMSNRGCGTAGGVK